MDTLRPHERICEWQWSDATDAGRSLIITWKIYIPDYMHTTQSYYIEHTFWWLQRNSMQFRHDPGVLMQVGNKIVRKVDPQEQGWPSIDNHMHVWQKQHKSANQGKKNIVCKNTINLAGCPITSQLIGFRLYTCDPSMALHILWTVKLFLFLGELSL